MKNIPALSLALGEAEIDSLTVEFIFFVDAFDKALEVFYRL